ncbi:hypothetical protein ABIE65_003326 [Constrictibacter sp. MBR-5]
MRHDHGPRIATRPGEPTRTAPILVTVIAGLDPATHGKRSGSGRGCSTRRTQWPHAEEAAQRPSRSTRSVPAPFASPDGAQRRSGVHPSARACRRRCGTTMDAGSLRVRGSRRESHRSSSLSLPGSSRQSRAGARAAALDARIKSGHDSDAGTAVKQEAAAQPNNALCLNECGMTRLMPFCSCRRTTPRAMVRRCTSSGPSMNCSARPQVQR